MNYGRVSCFSLFNSIMMLVIVILCARYSFSLSATISVLERKPKNTEPKITVIKSIIVLFSLRVCFMLVTRLQVFVII